MVLYYSEAPFLQTLIVAPCFQVENVTAFLLLR